MIVERIWTGNNYRNYNYLIVCPETGDALAVDPLDHEKCLGRAREASASGGGLVSISSTSSASSASLTASRSQVE